MLRPVVQPLWPSKRTTSVGIFPSSHRIRTIILGEVMK